MNSPTNAVASQRKSIGAASHSRNLATNDMPAPAPAASSRCLRCGAGDGGSVRCADAGHDFAR
jgi:hypothetical protein